MSPIIDHTHGGRSHRQRPLTAAAALVAAFVLAGCGAGSNHTTPTRAASTPKHTAATTSPPASSTGTSGPRAGRTSSTPGRTTAAFRSNAASPIVFAECMRANGVHNFPDPSPGTGAAFPIDAAVTSSPAFHSATAKCQKYMGGEADFQSNPSRQTMAKLLRIATCMRAHGIHQFPDPLYNRPKHFSPGKYQEITDYDGATLLFPTSMDLQAPAYRQALSACGAPPLGLPH